jgi:Cu-processing system permease protein
MLDRVLAIALNTYRESLRARILLGLMGAAFAGSASISIFSIAVAIVIGSTSLHRELEQKTLFPILARPIRRGEYLVGKYLGTLLTVAVFVTADAGLVLLISAALGGRSPKLVLDTGGLAAAGLVLVTRRSTWARTYGPIPWALLVLAAGVVLSGVVPDERRVVLGGGALALFEVAIIAAFGLLFASFSTPFLSALLTVGVIVIGRNADLLAQLPAKYFGAGVHAGGVVLSRVVPNLHVYVPPRPLLSGEAVGEPLESYLAMAGVSAVAWVVGLLAVASFIFRKRDFL